MTTILEEVRSKTKHSIIAIGRDREIDQVTAKMTQEQMRPEVAYVCTNGEETRIEHLYRYLRRLRNNSNVV